MLVDGRPFSRTPSGGGFLGEAIAAFVSFFEKRLGVRVIEDAGAVPYSRLDLREPLRVAELLVRAGVIAWFRPRSMLPDEPQFKMWSAMANNARKHHTAGFSRANDAEALYAALAEGLERFLWNAADDYLDTPVTATERDIATRGPHVSLARFAGFSTKDRERKKLKLRQDASYLWTRARSLTDGESVYVPVQVVSGAPKFRASESGEPVVRFPVTTGLATWPKKEGAILRGLLEVIERDAYMIMWLNQLSLPRISVEEAAQESESLKEVVETCRRYRLKVHAVRLITDAPTYVICVVLEDESGHSPRFALGLKAGLSVPNAIEGAVFEALRARRICRLREKEGAAWDKTTPIEKIGHTDRLLYWSIPEHAAHLEFLINGPEVLLPKEVWDDDASETHLTRLVEWCREKKYACLSVSLGLSKRNPTPWHVEMVIVPELQPTYLSEETRQVSGSRLASVPEAFGYKPRAQVYLDAPHPFC